MAGGGAVKLNVGSVLTVNGILSADGGSAGSSPRYSGGAGGSIWIVADTVAGSAGGVIRADGGNGTANYCGGAGGVLPARRS